MNIFLSSYCRFLLCFYILLFNGQFASAQRDNIWILSKGGIDFSSGIAQFYVPPLDTLFWEGSATVCTPDGHLLFFTNGTHIFDSRGQRMPNGSALIGMPDTTYQFNTASTTQGALIVPFPERPEQYIVFSLTPQEADAHYGKLFYSIVDMSLNGGYGDVVVGAKGILLDSLFTEKMSAVAGLNCNVWLVLRSRKRNAFKAFEITADGVSSVPVVSEVGSFNPDFYHVGTMQFSNDRRKLAVVNGTLSGTAGLEVLRFDNKTGKLSDPIVFDKIYASYYGVCFSPDDTKLYVTELKNALINGVYQFEVQAVNPGESKRKIDSTARATKIRSGPDQKLYYIDNDSLTVINNPNAPPDLLQINRKRFFVGKSVGLPYTLPNVIAEVYYDTVISEVSNLVATCWQKEIILLSGREGWGYRWGDSSVGTTLAVTQAGTYTLSYYTAPCTYHRDTFYVSFPHGVLPSVQINDACTNTATGTIQLKNGSDDTVQYTYNWYDLQNRHMGQGAILSHLHAGTYRLHIQAAGCDTQVYYTVKEMDYSAGFEVDTLVCTGTALAFQNQSDSYFTTWSWNFADGWRSEQRNPLHSFALPGVYLVTLSASGSVCSDTFAAAVRVDAPMVPFILQTDQDTLCAGEPVTLHYNQDSTLLLYHWQLNSEYLLSTRDTFMQYAFTEPGFQQLSLTAEFRACPEQTLTQPIFVAPMPRVILGIDTFLCPGANPIVLSNRVSPEEGDRFLWSTGAVTPEMMVQQPGNYALQVTNRYGCRASENIQVYKDCYTDIPNIFTPNGDGLNDYFFPRQRLTASVRTFHMQVLNRWGQLLFETRSLEGRGWDGRFNNIEQPAGAYIYHITAELDNGGVERSTGSVTLLR